MQKDGISLSWEVIRILTLRTTASVTLSPAMSPARSDSTKSFFCDLHTANNEGVLLFFAWHIPVHACWRDEKIGVRRRRIKGMEGARRPIQRLSQYGRWGVGSVGENERESGEVLV